MSRLLVVHHSPTDNVRSLTNAVLAGARDPDLSGVEIVERLALEASIDDVLGADGYLVGTPANFGYISGALKHFFDSTYDATHEATIKRPFSYWIHGSYDTTGAEHAMESITTGYGWTLATLPLVFTGEIDQRRLDAAYELGATLAATLM